MTKSNDAAEIAAIRAVARAARSIPDNCPKSYQGVGDERCWHCPRCHDNSCEFKMKDEKEREQR